MGAGVLIDDGLLGCPSGDLPHVDRPRRSDGLNPGGGVHQVAGDHALPLGADRHRCLAREHSGAGGEVGGPHLCAKGGDGRRELQRRPDGSLRVVLGCDRRPPHRHDRVADELLDRAAVASDELAGLQGEDLLANKGAQDRQDLRLCAPADPADPRHRERLAEHRAVLDQPPFLRRQTVQARGDQRVERLGDLERFDRTRWVVDVPLLNEEPPVEKHPDRLDRVERHALGPVKDPGAQVVVKAGDEA